LAQDNEYLNSLKKFVSDNELSAHVKFLDGVPQSDLPEVYNSHKISVNLTESGSFDKTIVEAAACGATPLVTNKSLSGLLPAVCITENNSASLADSILELLKPDSILGVKDDLQKFVSENSLVNLMSKLTEQIKK
jgi:glycosyltransferase involved in cell wall biosynthesis